MDRQQLLEQIDKTLSFTHLALVRSVCAGDISPADAAKNVLTLVPVSEWTAITGVPFDDMVQDALVFRFRQLRGRWECPRELVTDVLRDLSVH